MPNTSEEASPTPQTYQKTDVLSDNLINNLLVGVADMQTQQLLNPDITDPLDQPEDPLQKEKPR